MEIAVIHFANSIAEVLLPVGYVVTTLAYGLAFIQEIDLVERWKSRLLLSTTIVHFLYIGMHTAEYGRCMVTTPFEIMSLIAFTILMTYAIIEYRTNIRGSGFFINEHGEILTNFHVIDQSIVTYIQIPSLGKDRFAVEFIGANPEKDFAKLRLTPEALEEIKQKLNVQTLPYLTLGDSDTLSEAQEIMALGYPLGAENLKVSIGRFAGRESTDIGECIQTTTPINLGNSGGPFLDYSGNVVGIATLKSTAVDIEGIAYLIPINNITVMMAQLNNQNINSFCYLLEK